MKPSDIYDASKLLKEYNRLIEDLKRVRKVIKNREQTHGRKTLSFEAKISGIDQAISLPAESVLEAAKVTLRAQRSRLITLGVDEAYLPDQEI